MKKILRTLFAASLMLALFAACEKTDDNNLPDNNGSQNNGNGDENKDDPQDPEGPAVDETIIGYYTFNGTERPLRGALAQESDSIYLFMFTEEQPDDTVSSYIYFGLMKYFGDQSLDMGKLEHNYDYWLRYENPEYFFSEYRELRGGKAMVENLGDNYYHVLLDVQLNNGMPLKVDYTGKFLSAADNASGAAAMRKAQQ